MKAGCGLFLSKDLDKEKHCSKRKLTLLRSENLVGVKQITH